MNDCHSLGTAHRLRDAAATIIAQRQRELDDARSKTSLMRWPGVVAALRTHVAAYNAGIGYERLVVTETHRPTLAATVESTGTITPALVVTLDDAELRVDCPDAVPRHCRTTRWVAMARTDSDTAAYVLQDWMQRL
jgi:hypothetical protein